MRRRKHIAAKLGDHTGRVRDIAPNCTPVTLFTDDGETWMVADIDTSLVRAVRKHARREGVSANVLLSQIIVRGFKRLVKKGGL